VRPGFALVLSWLLARRWFRPIDELTQAAQDVARGRLSTRVAVHGSDELALLGKTFNDMAQRLDTVEASRRAWLADAAHELRTPLAAMRAEIEALQDGVRTFDERTALRLHRQVIRLGQLVDDLRSSMREPQSDLLTATVYPLSLLKEALDHTRDRFVQRGITVDRRAIDLVDGLSQPTVDGDAHRLHQVFMNLLENTLAYTDGGGELRIDVIVEAPGPATASRCCSTTARRACPRASCRACSTACSAARPRAAASSAAPGSACRSAAPPSRRMAAASTRRPRRSAGCA
jgi:two-component system sensor histidine kinase BaeS